MPDQTTLDVVTAVVAGYAAAVATAGVAVQGATWWRGWATRVKVAVRPGMKVATPGTPVTDHEDAIIFEIVNHSGHDVKIVTFWLARGWRRKRGGWAIPWLRGVPAPGQFTIPARDAVTPYLSPEDVEMTRGMAVRAYVKTSDGRVFRSRRTRLLQS